jgi:hypothetical protein
MEILDGGLEGAMAHQELNGTRIDPGIEQMGGKAVPLMSISTLAA